MSRITLIYDNNDIITENISIKKDIKKDNRSFVMIASSNKFDQAKEIADIINRNDIPILFDHAMHSSSQKANEISKIDISKTHNIPQDTEIIMFTSGTTGNPLGILKSQTNIANEVAIQKKWLQKYNLKQCLVTVPFFHIYGFLFGFSIPIAMDMDIITKEHFLPNEILDICSKAPTLCITNPVFIRSMLKVNYNYSLKDTLFISSSGPLETYEAKAFEKKYQTTLIQIYGSSETGGIAKREANETLWSPFKGVSISTKENVLYVNSPFVSNYIYDTDFTKIDLPFKTTEIVEMKDDGFKITGRMVEILKIGGKRLSVIEIERFLEAMDPIDEALVEATYDPKNIRGETLTIHMVSSKKDIDKRSIKRSIHDFFGGIHIECKIFIVDKIAKTSLGKKIRKPLFGKKVK